MKKFDNYKSQLAVLSRASTVDLDDEFILSGIAAKFSLQFELAWKLLKETLIFEGLSMASIGSPREVLKEAFSVYDFLDEDIWLEMLRARNSLSHIYDGEVLREIIDRIIKVYIPTFIILEDEVSKRYKDELLS